MFHVKHQKSLLYILNFYVSGKKKMNLVSNNSLQDAEIRHFLDSAQLYVFCKNLNGNLVDFGSGAGFPGAVLSILGASKTILIESNKKKM